MDQSPTACLRNSGAKRLGDEADADNIEENLIALMLPTTSDVQKEGQRSIGKFMISSEVPETATREGKGVTITNLGSQHMFDHHLCSRMNIQTL